MTDLQDAAFTLGRPDQPIRFLHATGHGLFQKDVDSHRQTIGGNLEVEGGGHGDAGRVDTVEQLRQGIEAPDP